ncbi:MAG: ABC transporter ATP-binding protein [Candidatus Hodarchaeota archaeon]
MSALLWLWKLHRRHLGKTLFVLIVSSIEVCLFMFPISIDKVIQGGGIEEISNDLVFLFFLAIFQAMVFFFICFVNEILAHRVTTDMTYELFESLQFRSLTYHNSKDVGQIMARATGDTRTVNIALSPGVRIVIAILTTWIVALYITVEIHWSLVLITLTVLITFLISSIFYGKGLIELSTQTLNDFSEISEVTSDFLTGIRQIKGYTAESWVEKIFQRKTVKHQLSKIQEGRKGAWFYPILIVTVYVVCIVGISLYLAFEGIISFHDVVLIAGFVNFLRGISYELDWTAWYLISGKAATNRIYTIITEPDIGEFEEGSTVYREKTATIEFRNVTFQYRAGLPNALTNVSFRVSENQTIAIVGAPGSGKSTVAKLIQRLYIPNKGAVYLGNRPINEFTNRSLRKHIATVEQDIFLFNNTVLENIRFGKPLATKEEVINVAKLAEAHEFISNMPNGYDSVVGEGGVKLSGGQAQRISIARALLMNPAILLMDDGASALDAKTEARIQKAITEILKTRTTVITTHRLAIIAKADLVLILEKGEVVGVGTHEELIHSNQYYRRLFDKHYELPPLLIEELK